MVTRISGIAPAIAFNLGGAMIFALTCVAAFSVGYNLWGTYRRRNPISDTPTTPRSALLAGILATLMLSVMGNLGGFMESVRCGNVLPQSFWAWLDVRQIATQPVECQGLVPTRFYWWWDWSRVVHDYTPTGADQEVITETPAFSFILGDNHPHVMSLPFVLIGVTLGLYYLTAQKTKGESTEQMDGQAGKLPQPSRKFSLDDLPVSQWLRLHAPDLILSATVIGGLSFMNTWDFPVYGALMAGALLLGRWYRREPLLPGIISSVIVFALGYLLYLPFYSTFASQARGIGVNLFNGTRFSQFCMMFATFIVLAPLFGAQTAHQMRLPTRRTITRVIAYLAAALLLALFAVAVFGLLSAQGRSYLAELNSTGSVMGVSKEKVIQLLTQRATDPWTPLYLLVLAVVCAIMILTPPWQRTLHTEVEKAVELHTQLVKSYVLLMFLGGALLTVAVEFIFLQDLFGTRMNTVFKFYYQGWTVWAVAGSFALMSLLADRHWIPRLGAGLVVLLLLAGMLFPAYAALSRTNNFTNKPTLDGSAYLKQSHPEDAAIINWLNHNVKGAPVIAEAPGDSYTAYSYTGRISAFTGLPTLLGWGGHEQQWRGNYIEPAKREPVINALFSSENTQEAQAIMRQYQVHYVIVGQTERKKYPAVGLDKFDQLCEVAFQSGQSIVYQCNP
jgi:YYY domain-containing protein